MKSLKKFFILASLVMFAVLSAQTNENQSKITETRNVAPFTGIKVSSGIEVYLSMGNEHKVSVETAPHILSNVITETKNGVLSINYSTFKNRNGRRKNEQIKVYVTATWLESIGVSLGSNLSCTQRMKLTKLTVTNSSGAYAYIDVECRDLALYSSSGSGIKIKGSTLNLTAKASSGSDIKARELESVNATLEASSGSNITVKISGEIDARASTGSGITYYGNVTRRTIRQTSGGEVRRRN